jgi:phytoene synthase
MSSPMLSAAAPSRTEAEPPREVISIPDSSTLAPGLRLLPDVLRADVYRLYHVLRALDDAVDDDRPEAEPLVAAVEEWTEGNQPGTRETLALADLADRYGLSPEPVAEFCQAMRHDIERSVIEDEDALESYCQSAGGAVGRMLAEMIGTANPSGEARLMTLGRAVQRTNILRDIDDDRAQGRVYIARTTIDRFGSPMPGHREQLLRDQIAKADALFDDALSEMPILSQGQRFLALSAALYRELLRQIEREGYGRKAGRVVVPAWRRRTLTARYRLTPERRAPFV